MTYCRWQEPMDAAQLETHARRETGVLAVVPPDKAPRLSPIATVPLSNDRKSLLKMFQEFFMHLGTAH